MGAVELKHLYKAALSVVLAVLLSVIGAGQALAQDNDEPGGQNSFQTYYDDCRNGETDGGIVDGGLLGGTGAPEWLRDSAHAGGLRQAVTAPANAIVNAACKARPSAACPRARISSRNAGSSATSCFAYRSRKSA